MFYVHNYNHRYVNIFGFVFEENSDKEISGLSSRYRLQKLHYQIVWQYTTKPVFSNSCGLKGVLRKAQFSWQSREF